MTDPGFDWNAEPHMLGLLQLSQDPQYPRIPADRHGALVEAALNDGYSLADRARDQWGDVPANIAARCGVPIVHSEEDAGFGSIVVYADYASRPHSITLYLPAIRELDRLLAGHSAPACEIGSTVPIFLAHELYHHFDCLRGSERLARRHTVEIFGIGAWRWTSGLSSLCEIAAGAFAQRLLGLSFHPKVLELLLLGNPSIDLFEHHRTA